MKTIKQTHELILTMINSNVLLQDMDSSDMNNIADSLDKRIPKIPSYEGDGYSDGEIVYDTWICPSCDESYEIDYDKYNYCPCCGQKIDWSDSNGKVQ